MRTTKEIVRKAFTRLCEIAERPVFDISRWPEEKQVGAWRLDNAPGYGGYIVEQVDNESLGVSRPLGEVRMSGKEFWNFVYRLERFLESTK